MRRWMSRASLVVGLLVAASAASAQTVDEIVAKSVAAKGGAEKWKATTSVKMSGKVILHAAQGLEAEIAMYARRPNHTRQDMVIQGTTIVQAFDGSRAWMINPMAGAGAQEMPGPLADMMKQNDFDGPLVEYKTKGNTVELVGKEKLADAEVYHLKVTTKSGHVQHYFIDAASGIELKKTEEVDLGQGGGKQRLETEMTKYQPVNGIMMPFVIRQSIEGKPVVEIVLDKIEFNATLADDLFAFPKK